MSTILGGRRGNPYPHRYREKVEEILSEEEFLTYLENAVKLENERRHKKDNPTCLAHTRIKTVKISGLLALIHYLGLRISEIVGDRPHKYFTKEGEERWTQEVHGLRKQDIRITKNMIRIEPKEIRKHGKRNEPLWIPIDLPGANYIVEQWELKENKNDRLFPISTWTAWSLISQITEGRLYPHYFRLNRATKFANQEETSIKDLQEWFGWRSMQTIEKYMGKAGRVTRRMARRLV